MGAITGAGVAGRRVRARAEQELHRSPRWHQAVHAQAGQARVGQAAAEADLEGQKFGSG
jgi:hypothetical protein